MAQDDTTQSDTAVTAARVADAATSGKVLLASALTPTSPATTPVLGVGSDPPAAAPVATAPQADPPDPAPVPADPALPHSPLDARQIADCCAQSCGQCKPPEPNWDFHTDTQGCCNQTCDDWRVWGEIDARAGQTADTDDNFAGFELNEELKRENGDRFTFYQKYEQEQNFVNDSTLTIGAKQVWKDWRQHSDLRLQEEFKRYVDNDFASNNRQEGLFDLHWDPRWACDHWRAEISYRYNIKEYETFSPLSYRLHRGRIKIENKVDETFSWGVSAEAVSYNYSFGSDRDNLRTEVGLEAGWHASDDVQVRASLEHEKKDFDVQKDFGYDETRFESTLAWRIDCDSRLNARIKAASHDRPFQPDESYDEKTADVTYMRQLSCEWALQARGMVRKKDFTDPTRDLDERLGQIQLDFHPCGDWSYTGSFQRDVYGYADPLRAFTQDQAKIGAQYNHCDTSFGIDLNHQVNTYDNDPLRNWQRDTVELNLDYREGCSDFTVYATLGRLDQSDPASVNDYSETQLSASWDYKIDCKTDFILSYEDRQRQYEVQPTTRDQTIEARLKFDL